MEHQPGSALCAVYKSEATEGEYTWTFVFPAQTTDERRRRGRGECEQNKVNEGMERREGGGESGVEKDYFVILKLVQMFDFTYGSRVMGNFFPGSE